VATINNKALVITSCWLAVALISSVYIWVALSQNLIGDIFFGLFMPIGLLVLVALAVTFGLPMKEDENTVSTGIKEMNAKIDSLTREVEVIKKAIED
jgi:hypothetical protein